MSNQFMFRNPYLMVGTILKEMPPTKGNSFKKYLVKVEVLGDNDIPSTFDLPCRIASDFGGIADHSNWTPRLRTETTNKPIDLKNPDPGTQVLVLAVNGNIYDSLIIGGYPHFASPEDKTEGINLVKEFNGILVSIDKDGQLTLTRRGATLADGKVDSNNDTKGGQTVTFDKEGSITLKSSKGNSITLNDKDDTIDVNANQNLNIKSGAKVSIDSTGVLAGADGAKDAFVMGTTYRDAQQSLHQTLQTELTKASIYMGVAAGALTTAAIAHKTPIVGAVIGSPGIDMAAQSLMQVMTNLQSMMQALMQFEAKASTYLSQKNFGD